MGSIGTCIIVSKSIWNAENTYYVQNYGGYGRRVIDALVWKALIWKQRNEHVIVWILYTAHKSTQYEKKSDMIRNRYLIHWTGEQINRFTGLNAD